MSLVLVLVGMVVWNHFNSRRVVATVAVIQLTKAWTVFQLLLALLGVGLHFSQALIIEIVHVSVLRACSLPVWHAILITA